MKPHQLTEFFSSMDVTELLSLYIEYTIGEGKNDAHLLDYATAESIEAIEQAVEELKNAYREQYS